MTFTREEIIQKIKENDAEFFHKIYNDSWKLKDDVKEVWNLNWGDGNDWFIALEFTKFNITILLEGYYSSHGDSEFSKVSYAIPYEFKETRYKAATKAELRDMKIDEIIG